MPVYPGALKSGFFNNHAFDAPANPIAFIDLPSQHAYHCSTP